MSLLKSTASLNFKTNADDQKARDKLNSLLIGVDMYCENYQSATPGYENNNRKQNKFADLNLQN